MAKGKQRDDASQRTDDDQYGRDIDGPVPDSAGVEPFMKIAEPAHESAALFFDFGSAIVAVDGHHCASAGSGERHLYLVGIIVIVRRRRSDAESFAEVPFERGLIGMSGEL